MALPIIGITGLKGSGKDTAGAYLVERYGFHRQSFADALKVEVATAIGRVTTEFFSTETLLRYIEENKRHPVDHSQGWPRQMLQAWGVMQRDLSGSTYWVNQIDFQPGLVVCDVRFPNEAEAIHTVGGLLLRINRADVAEASPVFMNWLAFAWNLLVRKEDPFTADRHSSESQIASLEVDWDIDNNDDLPHLYQQLDAIVQHYVLYPQARKVAAA